MHDITIHDYQNITWHKKDNREKEEKEENYSKNLKLFLSRC